MAGANDRRRTMAAVGSSLAASAPRARPRPQRRAGMTADAMATLTGQSVPEGTAIRTFASTAGATRFHVAHLRDAARTLVMVRDHPGATPAVRIVRPR